MKKYYFITYQATKRQGSFSIWNEVIDKSPMDFIKQVQFTEEAESNTYYNFVVINTCQISKANFLKFDGHF